MPSLSAWDSFYLIVSGAAGALIGLQFVVMTLMADSASAGPMIGGAFASPTVVHFSAVLLLGALLRVPWTEDWEPSFILGAMGIAGMIYMGIVTRRVRKQTGYQPDREDWLSHVFVPLFAYGLLAVSGFEIAYHLKGAMFGLGAGALLLLFDGIHNAWDAVAFNVFVTRRKAKGPPQ